MILRGGLTTFTLQSAPRRLPVRWCAVPARLRHVFLERTPGNGQQAALGVDVIALMDALRIGGATLCRFRLGRAHRERRCALWPERCAPLVSGAATWSAARKRTRRRWPEAELGWWYRFYFATGAAASAMGGIGASFRARSGERIPSGVSTTPPSIAAQSFDNPDRLDHDPQFAGGLGRRRRGRYDELRASARARPAVPITSRAMRAGALIRIARRRWKFWAMSTGHLSGTVANLPQEAPAAFAKAVIDVASRSRRRRLGSSRSLGSRRNGATSPGPVCMTSNEILFLIRCRRVCHHRACLLPPGRTWMS